MWVRTYKATGFAEEVGEACALGKASLAIPYRPPQEVINAKLPFQTAGAYYEWAEQEWSAQA